jgi:hypothetical protein
MNKNRLILAASGGVIGLAALVLAFLTWQGYSAKVAALEGDDEEGTEGLESVQAKAQTLSRKAVYPCPASARAIASNETCLADWRAEALKLASRGDRPVRATTPAQFKTELVEEAKRLIALPGAVGGALAKPDFAFGPFRPYVAEGKMPAPAELPALQRRWDDVSIIVEALANCGVAELVDVAFKEEKKADDDQPANKRKRRPAKKADAAAAKAPAACSYVFTFTTRAPGFVKAINALGTNERFIVVDGFSLVRSADPIGQALGAGEKRESASSSGRRRGRRGAPAPEERKADAAKDAGIVTDPLLDAPFTVALTATVYDFRTMEEESQKKEEVSK